VLAGTADGGDEGLALGGMVGRGDAVGRGVGFGVAAGLAVGLAAVAGHAVRVGPGDAAAEDPAESRGEHVGTGVAGTTVMDWLGTAVADGPQLPTSMATRPTSASSLRRGSTLLMLKPDGPPVGRTGDWRPPRPS